jgi:formylglycine-generating enzyme required for sulfatase activity
VNGSNCDEPQYARIEAGVDLIGRPSDQATVTGYEDPARVVTISRPFWLQKTEVTREQWSELTGTPLSGDGKLPHGSAQLPHVLGYLNLLSRREGLTECYFCQDSQGQTRSCDFTTPQVVYLALVDPACDGWRLPTEAEWEYAARAGSDALYPTGGEGSLPRGAWFAANALGQPHPVAQRAPNAWGLYDMAGNLWEFVWGFAGSQADNTNPVTDPLELEFLSYNQSLAMRGGSYVTDEGYCRSAAASPALFLGHPEIGFRAARTIFE